MSTISDTVELIDRHEILALCKVSRSHALKIIVDPQHKFPKPVKSVGKKLFYKKKQVLDWLKKNDMAKINYPGEKAVAKVDINLARPVFDNSLVLSFLAKNHGAI